MEPGQGTPPLTFGALLRRYRRDAALTQEELAERAGLSLRTIGDIERGIPRVYRSDTVDLLARALRLSEPARIAFRAAAVVLMEADDSVPVAYSATLPAQTTSFLGRDKESLDLTGLLRGGRRLVTLTGPPGVGKTRLALRVASALAGTDAYPAGAVFVELAAVQDHTGVLAAIAAALGVREKRGPSIEAAFTTRSRAGRLLLVLDNFEHVLPAVPLIVAMLAAPNLAILATSRIALGARGEQVVAVTPLILPPPGPLASLDALASVPSVALFIERARAVSPTFVLSAHNAAGVAAVCRTLDGLPLAIEFAAAWIRTFTPGDMAARLPSLLALPLPAIEKPVRQLSLWHALDWSHALLDAPARVLLRRLTVFTGGATLLAVEAVCAVEDDPILGGSAGVARRLRTLIEANLIRLDTADGEPRVGMLETVREYARERLAESDESEMMVERHAQYYLRLADTITPDVDTPGPIGAAALARLEHEHDNLRATLRWTLTTGDATSGLRLAASLSRFWAINGYYTEGIRWLEETLAAAARYPDAPVAMDLDEDHQSKASIRERVPAAVRARALVAASELVLEQGDPGRAGVLCAHSLDRARAAGDRTAEALSLVVLGSIAGSDGDDIQQRALHEEGLAILRTLDDPRLQHRILLTIAGTARTQAAFDRAASLYNELLGVYESLHEDAGRAMVLYWLGYLARLQGRYEDAWSCYDKSLTLARNDGNVRGEAWTLLGCGDLARDCGDSATVEARSGEALRLFQRLGDNPGVAYATHNIGVAFGQRGDIVEARTLCTEALVLFKDAGDRGGASEALASLGTVERAAGDDLRAEMRYSEALEIAWTQEQRRHVVAALEGLASMAARHPTTPQLRRTAFLLGAADGLSISLGLAIRPVDRAVRESDMTRARAALGEVLFARAWDEGHSLPLARVVAQALTKTDASDTEPTLL